MTQSFACVHKAEDHEGLAGSQRREGKSQQRRTTQKLLDAWPHVQKRLVVVLPQRFTLEAESPKSKQCVRHDTVGVCQMKGAQKR